MTTRRFPLLANPPITEGLLDVRVGLRSDVGLETLARFGDAVGGDYPNRRERYSFAGAFQFGVPTAASSVSSQTRIDGYVFTSENAVRVVQARLDGFTLSLLKPYPGFDVLEREAMRLWELYCQVAQPQRVVRIALRYINRIVLPLPFKDFREYLLTIPEIAPNAPQALAQFTMQLVLPDDQDNANVAIITEVLEPGRPDATEITIVLDIDAFQQVNIAPGSTELWDRVVSLRDYKNRIFFSSITPKCRSLFE